MTTFATWMTGLGGYPELPLLWTATGAGIAVALAVSLATAALGLIAQRDRSPAHTVEAVAAPQLEHDRHLSDAA